MIYIVAIALSAGGDRPSHITHLKWQSGSSEGYSTRQTIVDWVDEPGNQAKVKDGWGPDVLSVHPVGAPAYVRSSPNDTPSDNLLALPRFLP